MEVNRQQVGVLRLSTLAANTLNFTVANRQTTYGWYVDWGLVFGHADEDENPNLTYEVEHFFEGNWTAKFATPNANVNAPYAFTTPNGGMIYVGTNLPILSLNSPVSPLTPTPYNGSVTTVFTTIDQVYPQFTVVNSLGSTYGYWYGTSRRRSFISKSPRHNSLVTIQTNPTSNNQHAAAPTNNYLTTSDFFTTGVHTFTFYKLQKKPTIMREIDPEIIGTLTLSTLNSSAQQYNATTGTQMYTWNNVDWNLVLGHIPSPKDSVWEVTFEFSPNATPSQTVSQAQLAPGIAQAAYFSPTVFVSSSLNGKNNTPGLFNTIGTLSYFLTCFPIISGTWWQWVYGTVSRKSTFVCYNPELNSQVSIVTNPAFNATYTQTAGTNVTVFQSYPNDSYTSGAYKFTFRRVKNKPN